MSQEILVNVTAPEVRVALLESGTLQEVHIERGNYQGLSGNIYQGRVGRLLPGIQAAFVDIGLDRSAFLHISDMNIAPDIVEKAGSLSQVDIRELLHTNQEILVQVYKDPLGSKGPRLTKQFTIPSRYLVLTPGVFEMAVSLKITDEVERARLLQLLQASNVGGFIFRTNAEGALEADLLADKAYLMQLWSHISEQAKRVKKPGLVYEEIPMVLRVLRDWVGYDVDKIRVDHEETALHMRQFAKSYVPALEDKIEYYHSPKPIFDLYSVEKEINKALERKVELKSGGHLIIDQTEAMTTIDVNTGSYVGNHHLEQTAFTTNLEAVEIIARQVRLRNLGGIIIIDFIDMPNPDHQVLLMKSLEASLAKDSARIQLSEISSLGLVQLTRKRTRESLEHILCVTCPLCRHRGTIKSIASVTYEIYRELKRLAENYTWPGFKVLLAPIIAKELLSESSSMLLDLETELGKPIQLQIETTYTQERFNVMPLSEKE